MGANAFAWAPIRIVTSACFCSLFAVKNRKTFFGCSQVCSSYLECNISFAYDAIEFATVEDIDRSDERVVITIILF